VKFAIWLFTPAACPPELQRRRELQRPACAKASAGKLIYFYNNIK
jgi:hypothetical protein